MIPGVRLIYVFGSSRGLVGLEEIYERVRAQGPVDPEKLAEALVEAVARRNYIPDRAQAAYARALLLDYRLWSGDLEPRQVLDAAGVIEARILGQRCPQCEQLEARTMETLAESGVNADVAHVYNPAEMASFGPVVTPAQKRRGPETRSSDTSDSRRQVLQLLLKDRSGENDQVGRATSNDALRTHRRQVLSAGRCRERAASHRRTFRLQPGAARSGHEW